MKKFIGADREQRMLMPYDLGDWLPEDHLARFIVDIVDKLDFNHIYIKYKGVGSDAYDPRMLLSLLF
ncbi:MAG: IS5/IS1182 family transposase, partial [Mangrovibacterium sp.]